MRFFTTLTLLSFFVNSFSVAFAEGNTENKLNKLSNERKGEILNNFKKTQKETIFEQDFGIDVEDSEVFVQTEKVRVYEIINDRINSKKEEYIEESLKLQKRVVNLKDTLDNLDDAISKQRREIVDLNVQVAGYISSIRSTKEEIEQVETKIQANREILLEYLIHLYKEQNKVYNEDKIDNLKIILLEGGNIGDVLSDYNFKTIIEVTAEKLIEKNREYVKDLFILKTKLSTQVDESRKKKRRIIIMKKVLEEKRTLKEKLLDVTKGREDLFKKYLQEEQDRQNKNKVKFLREKLKLGRLKDRLSRKYSCPNLVDKTKEATDARCETLAGILESEGSLSVLAGDEVKLSWPVLPENGLSSYFGDPYYYKTFGASHDAIDIPVPQGTPLTAPADGYVLYVQEPTTGNYSYVAIKHSNDLITVHGHLSEVKVKQYDFVYAGDVFALSGGEVGSDGAGIMTTGPHLHMELFIGEETKDPLNYLDLTYLDIDDIPQSRYTYKYYEDFVKRYGEESSDVFEKLTFKVAGNTEIERQKALIRKYSHSSFRNWDMWVEESVEAKVDPTFVMCIGLAETGLGRNTKTKNNVGNIGNTDSGATKMFDSPRSGIYWMGRTLNNRYLGGYNKVSDLSRYGNKTGPIYASSPDHWHNNVIKCMSTVKGEYIKDDYNFRLLPDEDVEISKEDYVSLLTK